MNQNDLRAATSDSLSLMMEQERTIYASFDYLGNKNRDHKENIVLSNSVGDLQVKNRDTVCFSGGSLTPSDRTLIVDWCYAIVDECQLDRDGVAVAMNIVDRFMNNPSSKVILKLNDRVQYQLVAVTALYIAIKLNEIVAVGSDGFSAISQGTYAAEDIEEMERIILYRLSWRLNPPTSLQVGYQILALLLPNEVTKTLEEGTYHFLADETKIQVENSVRDNYFTTRWPSTIALAAILNAIEQLVNDKDYKYLLKAVQLMLEEFDFCSPMILLSAKERLRHLMDENVEL